MDILYVSRLCSEGRLARLLAEQPVKPALQEQKFHGLLARGLAAHAPGLAAQSLLPPHPAQRRFLETDQESEGGIAFRYLSPRNIPILSHAATFLWSFLAGLRWSRARRGSERLVVCDVLNLSITAGALLAAKATGARSLAIVTDVPDYLHGYIGGGATASGRLLVRAYRILATFFMTRYDGYVLLTEAMDPLVNPRRRPHVVVEGMVDPGMAEVANPLEGKFPERVILYAGALYEKYGVGTLLEAFRRLPHPEARLWLYGSGELEPLIRAQAAEDPRISFHGIRPNAEVVAAEVRATLLVNPRPSSEPFTRLSFPSKNMEYMASGTPVLTTPLPGMPDAYLAHVYAFEDESAAGMAATLGRLLDLPPADLHARGQAAKAFVLASKTNLAQAGRIHALAKAMASVHRGRPRIQADQAKPASRK